MTTVAKNLFLTQAASDGKLSQKEFQGLLDVLFDAKDPLGQVDFNDYALVDAFIESELKTGKVTFSADDPFTPGTDENNKHVLFYLASGFPGSLVSFKTRLSKYFGIPLPAFETKLPELTVTRFERDAKNHSLYHFDVHVTGTDPETGEPYVRDDSFGYDVKIKKYVTDGSSIALASAVDAINALGSAYLKNELSEDQTALVEEFNAKLNGFPNNGIDLGELLKMQVELVGPECDTFHMHSEPFPEKQRIANAPGVIPAYGDATLDAGLLQKSYGEACRILGDGALSFLRDNGFTIGFYDFANLARGTQMKGIAQDHAVYDLLPASAAGVCEIEPRKISINTRANSANSLISTIIHEVGHAVNFLIQQSHLEVEHLTVTNPDGTTQEALGSEFTGAQKSLFLDNSFYVDEKLQSWDSRYAASNDAEWFAEKFLHVMLERGGRLDLLRALPDHNPLLELSPILVNASEYFLMSKIVQTLDEGAEKPENLKILTERGIDDALWESSWQAAGIYEVWRDDEESGWRYRAIQSQLKAGSSSKDLKFIQRDWAQWNIADLYAQDRRKNLVPDGFYDKIVTSDWTSRDKPENRAFYMPVGDGSYAYQRYAEHLPDFKAIYLAVQMERADLSVEEKGFILFENGITSEESLGVFCQNLTALEPEQVKPVLGKTEFLAAAQTAALAEYAKTSYLFQYYEDSLDKAAEEIKTQPTPLTIPTLERMTGIIPEEPGVFFYLAAAHALADRSEESRTALAKALALGDSSREWKSRAYDEAVSFAEAHATRGEIAETAALCDIARALADDQTAFAAKEKALKKTARHPERPVETPAEPVPAKEITNEDLRKLLMGQ